MKSPCFTYVKELYIGPLFEISKEYTLNIVSNKLLHVLLIMKVPTSVGWISCTQFSLLMGLGLAEVSRQRLCFKRRESFVGSVLESGAVNTQYPVGFLEGKMAKLACIPVTMFSFIVFVIVFMCIGANKVEAQAPGSLPSNEGTFCLYVYLHVILLIKLKLMESEISILKFQFQLNEVYISC